MRAIGIILAGGNSKRMRELSNKRAISAMPIAGSYRSIDFALSNMSNSHVQNVAVFTQYNSRSLNEHLSSSKWWDFGRKQGGLYIFTPTITAEHNDWYRGTADALDVYKRQVSLCYLFVKFNDLIQSFNFFNRCSLCVVRTGTPVSYTHLKKHRSDVCPHTAAQSAQEQVQEQVLRICAEGIMM